MSTESESSLPTEVAHTVRSSPPIHTQYSLSPMDDSASKSEPAAPQEGQQSRDVQTPRRSKHKRVDSDSTERPASAQRDGRDGSSEHSDVEAELDPSDEDADPAEPIVNFDWDELHENTSASGRNQVMSTRQTGRFTGKVTNEDHT
ncbi:hypothetical protein E8E11_005498 [Didymella keratinophila]|nr:hypothetical protein E8E11_005498 [Didymella keratinophila]